MNYIGGTKQNEKRIMRYNQMSVSERTHLLVHPSVKKRKTEMGKYHAMLKLI